MSFKALISAAQTVLNPRELSRSSSAGQVAAALLTDRGNIYTGVCIDTPCSMGFCAEHAAAAAMVTAGEHRVVRMVAIDRQGVVAPCGRCRELIAQLHDDNHACLVLLPNNEVMTVADLLPQRWN